MHIACIQFISTSKEIFRFQDEIINVKLITDDTLEMPKGYSIDSSDLKKKRFIRPKKYLCFLSVVLKKIGKTGRKKIYFSNLIFLT